MSSSVVANFCAMCHKPCPFPIKSVKLPVSKKSDKNKPLSEKNQSFGIKKTSLKNTRYFSTRMAVMKRISSIRQGPLTDFINKRDYFAIKSTLNSNKNNDGIIAQMKQSAIAPIPVQNGSAENGNCEWNLVPQRIAALKKVASVQNGPLTDFKSKKAAPTAQKKATFAKKSKQMKKKLEKKSVALKSSNGKSETENKLIKLRLRQVIGKAFYKNRLSNPGLIIFDDNLGNRLFIHDALNMYRESCDQLNRRQETVGRDFPSLGSLWLINSKLVMSYIPSGSFEKTVKSQPPLYSSWVELREFCHRNK